MQGQRGQAAAVHHSAPPCLTALALVLTLGPPSAHAQDGADPPFKLTLGAYRYPDDTGHDVNLRWQHDDTHLWLGAYEDRGFGTQWRTGVDGNWALQPWLALQPSLQLASGGFVGGSATLQIGAPWFALIGWGRTNLKPYFNLNFDPNDAYTAGLGWRGDDGRSLTATLIADDRLHTGQKHWHLTARWPTVAQQRLTLDLLRKSGQGDEEPVRAWGWSIGYDWPVWFVHCARDPKQNFSTQDALRLSVGRRW